MEKKVRRYLPLIVAVTLLAMSALACTQSDTPDVELTSVGTAQAVQPVGTEEVPNEAPNEAPNMETQQAEAMEETARLTRVAQGTPDADVTAEPGVTPTATPLPTDTPEPTTEVAVTFTPTPVTLTPETSATGQTYTVKAGDNLFRIALRHGTTVNAIASANNITNPAMIFVGQVLTISSSGSPAPSTGGTTHVVQPGDNLFRIALRYNLSYVYLAQYNNIANPSSINVGQVIRIP